MSDYKLVITKKLIENFGQLLNFNGDDGDALTSNDALRGNASRGKARPMFQAQALRDLFHARKAPREFVLLFRADHSR